MNKKRAQEEMIGFVLIIVLVAVIGLVFLGLSIRKTEEIGQSKDIENFLHSSLFYTTSCYKSAETIYNLQDLIKACYNYETCLDGKDSCEVLDLTIKEIIGNSWDFSGNAKEKAYIFNIYDKNNNSLISLSEGEETGTKKGAEIPIYVQGENIYVKMSVFY